MDKAKVLIVEDEWIIANDIQSIVMDLGYTVTAVVDSGEEAIKEIDREVPDVVLMDIILPGKMNGIEAAKVIRDRLDIPVIYITAYDNKFLMDQAEVTDHSGFLLKPFKNKDLREVIESALKKQGSSGSKE